MSLNHQIYVGIGSNIDRSYHIKNALLSLREQFSQLTLSPVYETIAMGFEGDNFYNLVASFISDLPLATIEKHLKNIEDQAHRDRSQQKFSPRTLDIDLLLFDNKDLQAQQINIPRDEILKYAFVLKPLFDIAPKLIHPQTNQSITEHWNAFKKTNKEEVQTINKIYL